MFDKNKKKQIVLLTSFILACVVFFFSFKLAWSDTTSSLLPIADGVNDSASWFNTAGTACSTANCALEVDETTGGSCSDSDGATSYIRSSGSTISQTFDLDESSIPDGATITQISITACYDGDGQSGGAFQLRRCLDGSCVDSGTSFTATTAYQEITQNFTVNYVKSSSSDIEIGVSDVSGNRNTRVSKLKSIVTYTLPDTTAPSAISNLSASNPTTSTIDLSWTSPGDDAGTGTATTYDIRYSTATINDGNWASATSITGEPTPLIAGTSQSMTVTGLNPSTTYYFAIKTSDEVPNTSALSNIANQTTSTLADTTAPSAVSDLSASNPTTSTIDLSWTSPGDDAGTGTATTYDIRYSTATINDGNWASATSITGEPTPLIAGTSQSMTVTGLGDGTTYYFAMKTSDEVPNTSLISNVANQTTTVSSDATAPSAITNLSASNPTNSTIDLSWTAPGDDNNVGTATLYDIRYSTATINDSNWSSATSVTGEPTPLIAGTSQSMTVTGLGSGITYYFAIKTLDEASNTSALSNITNQTTGASSDTTAPASVGDLSAYGATSSLVNLSWTAPGDDNNTGTASSYDVRYSTATINDSSWSSATLVTGEPTPSASGSSEAMIITGLSPSTTYYFAIKTSDEVPNTSALSNVATVTTSATGSATSAGGGITPTIISFSGKAFSGGDIKVLMKDNLNPTYRNVPVTTKSFSKEGIFSVSYSGLLTGEYVIALVAVDKNGNETGTMIFNVDFRTTPSLIVDGILFPPTLVLGDDTLSQEDVLNVSGYSSLGSSVELFVDDKSIGSVNTNGSGLYNFSFEKGKFSVGTHYVKVRQTSGLVASNFSIQKSFKIVSLTFYKADFNDDGKIGVSDWSIFLYRWVNVNNPLRDNIDLDNNGIINVIDFSIFLKAFAQQ